MAVVLTILDGWGILPSWGNNPVSLSNPSFMSFLWQNYPHHILEALSLVVNPYGVIGSSEIGYASIGSGRMIEEPLSSITGLIKKGDFFRNKALLGGMQSSHGRVHLVGLISDGAVHSHLDHLEALLKMTAENNIKEVYVHAILDGVDVPPRSGYYLLEKIGSLFKRYGIGSIATLTGRNYAMDPAERGQMVKQAVLAMIHGKGRRVFSWQQAMVLYYQSGFFDPDIAPTVIVENDRPIGQIKPQDTVILFNSRFDKTKLLCDELASLNGVNFISFVNQITEKNIVTAFPFGDIANNLTDFLERRRLTQARITESLKRYHLEYFFQGTMRPTQSRYDRFIDSDESQYHIRSPGLKTPQITNETIGALNNGVDFIVAAYANPDVLGHIGDIDALNRGIDILLKNLERLYHEVLNRKATLIITADHGNAEQIMPHRFNWYGQRHTKNPVPFIIVSADNKIDLYHRSIQLETDILSQIARPEASLADVAPTIIELFGLEKPPQMTGNSLLKRLK